MFLQKRISTNIHCKPVIGSNKKRKTNKFSGVRLQNKQLPILCFNKTLRIAKYAEALFCVLSSNTSAMNAFIPK